MAQCQVLGVAVKCPGTGDVCLSVEGGSGPDSQATELLIFLS